MTQQSLFLAIVNRGRGEDVLGEMRAFGLNGAVIFLGEGTISNRFLEILGLEETQKDVIYMPVPAMLEDSLHEMMLATFDLRQKNRGIAFSMPLSRFGTEQYLDEGERFDPRSFEYHCIVVIVDRGRSRDCLRAARKAGAGGGTIVHGRGAGVPADSYFPIMVEPQKDIVLLLTPTSDVLRIRKAVVEELELNKPGNGILFVMPISRATGLYTGKEAGK